MPTRPTAGTHSHSPSEPTCAASGTEPGFATIPYTPYALVMLLSIQKMPMARHIQPMGFSGRLEAIRAPTTGKARKGNRKMSTALRPPVPQELGGCTDRVTKYNTTVATNITTESAPSDHASQEAVRVLIAPTPRPCSLVPSVTPPLYSSIVSKALRHPLR